MQVREDIRDFPHRACSPEWPPDHRRLRMLVRRAFTQGTVAGLESRIRVITGELPDVVAGAPRFDLVATDAGRELTATAIATLIHRRYGSRQPGCERQPSRSPEIGSYGRCRWLGKDARRFPRL